MIQSTLKKASRSRIQIKSKFCDTAGQERYKTIAKIYYKDFRAAVMPYAAESSGASFEELKNWVKELKNNTN